MRDNKLFGFLQAMRCQLDSVFFVDAGVAD
jgi:hypothetical protein